mgnify:CR=1 FL=1
MKAITDVTIGKSEPSTIVIDTNPLVVAKPIRKFARKSAIPIKIKRGKVFAGMPPIERNRSAISAAMDTDVTRMVVIVKSELSFDPIAIKVNAAPKPNVAPSARASGFSESPL